MNTLTAPAIEQDDESHWLSVSDLMAGLMMVFLFIAIALMRNAIAERDKIKEVAVAYQENQVAIYQALMTEFESDLTRWNADIDEDTLTFTFKAPEILFETGKVELSEAYKSLLTTFFPRYISVLSPFKASINEVRIEGHTSSIWNHDTPPDEAYFHNMRLSQGRTRSVLEYIYSLPTSIDEQPWLKKYFAAVGLSSSRPIMTDDGVEDRAKSRRVSFRVITNAEIQIKRILDEA
jgi:outer membrane protein OmpA-like peptidoglycan-associated protein